MNTEELLAEFFNTRKPKFTTSNYWDKSISKDKEFWSGDKEVGPHSFEDATRWKNILKPKFDFISEIFYNKRIKIGEYELIIQYNHEAPHRTDNYGDSLSLGNRREAYAQEKIVNVIACYHGLYISLAKFKEYYIVVADYCNENQTNYFKMLFKDRTKPYMMKEYNYKQEYNFYDKVQDIIKSLDNFPLNGNILTDSDIDFQEWYSSYDSKCKNLQAYSKRDIDFKWFILNDTKDGIFKPEQSTIDNILSFYKPDKELLKKIGIHTVVLRANCHFNISNSFNLKGITLKAPKSVVQSYGLEKFCDDKEIVKKIKEEDEQLKRDYELKEYNNKFTLIQHGKVLFENKPKYEIIQYLEAHSSAEFEPEIIKNMQPVFDHFEKLNKFYIGTWGQYSQYESRGERKGYDTDTEDINEKLMDAETFKELYELFENNIYMDLDEKVLDIKYGWPDM